MNESPSKVKKRIVNEHSYSAPKMSPSKTIKKLLVRRGRRGCRYTYIKVLVASPVGWVENN